MPEKRKFDLREIIDTQKSLLETIKTANAYELDTPRGGETESIAEKVRARQGLFPGEIADLSVSVGKVKDDEGNDAGERVWVQTAIPEPENPNKTNYKYTPIASVFEEAVLPEDGFVDEEAMAVSGMVEGLKEAKRIGVLTHLEPNLTKVQDPTTMLMMLPPVDTNTQK
jgi:hypothetical protein